MIKNMGVNLALSTNIFKLVSMRLQSSNITLVKNIKVFRLLFLPPMNNLDFGDLWTHSK